MARKVAPDMVNGRGLHVERPVKLSRLWQRLPSTAESPEHSGVPCPEATNQAEECVAVSGWTRFQVGELRSHSRDQGLIRLSSCQGCLLPGVGMSDRALGRASSERVGSRAKLSGGW